VSSLIFPQVAGISGLEVNRNYVWKTSVQGAVSGKDTALALRQYTLVHYELVVNLLRHNQTPSELLQVQGIYNAMKGRGDTFLYNDPEFNTITAGNAAQYGVFGVGDGTTLVFQLLATFQNAGGPGAPEMIQNGNPANWSGAVLYDNGTPISSANYAIGPTGIVTFGAGHAPAAGHTLTWSGSWYYRCRFDEDEVVWSKFMTVGLWNVKKLAFTSKKL
jgi:uncharacterized protein (TIGR02217 family)